MYLLNPKIEFIFDQKKKNNFDFSKHRIKVEYILTIRIYYENANNKI